MCARVYCVEMFGILEKSDQRNMHEQYHIEIENECIIFFFHET